MKKKLQNPRILKPKKENEIFKTQTFVTIGIGKKNLNFNLKINWNWNRNFLILREMGSNGKLNFKSAVKRSVDLDSSPSEKNWK